MRKSILPLLLVTAAVPAFAQKKDCSELKAEIDAKITRNGVRTFTTTIVEKGAEADGTVVGTCDGGTRSIVYTRGQAKAI